MKKGSIIHDLTDKVEKAFGRYDVDIQLTVDRVEKDRVIFRVRLRGGTREKQMLACLYDVQLRLRLPLFQIFKDNFVIYLVVAKNKLEYPQLPLFLIELDKSRRVENEQLPYVVGFNSVGKLVISDLGELKHLLVGGASNSGKTVGLKSLIASIAFLKSPAQVNFILIDVGATDLTPFGCIPHLSCPIIQDRRIAYQVLLLLQREMERRIKLQRALRMFPKLVLVVDEFPALFLEEDKETAKRLSEVISSLLQRGRHAGISVVLSAQNPTLKNMRVDLGNVTARIAFRCAKRNFSETILGAGGAENLSGKGDMLFQSPQCAQVQRIQGVYISPDELERLLIFVKRKWVGKCNNSLKFIISKMELSSLKSELTDDWREGGMPSKQCAGDKLLAKVIIWTLGQATISCNAMMREFGIGWNRANNLMSELYDLQMIQNLDAKLPRKVLPQTVNDLPEKVMALMEENRYLREDVENAFRGEH